MAFTRANLLAGLFCVWTAVKTADAAPTMERRNPYQHHSSHDGWANATTPYSSASGTAMTTGIYTDQPGNSYTPIYVSSGSPDIGYTASYISTTGSDTPYATTYASTTESNMPCTTGFLSIVQSGPAITTRIAYTHSKPRYIYTPPCDSVAQSDIWSTTTILAAPPTTPCAETTSTQSTTQPTSTYGTTSSALAQTEGLPCPSDSQFTYSAAGNTWSPSSSQVSSSTGTTSYMYAPQPTDGTGIASTTISCETTSAAGNPWSGSSHRHTSATSITSDTTISTWMPPTQVTSTGSSSQYQYQYPPVSESPSCPSMSTSGCPPAAQITTSSVSDSQSMSTTIASMPPPENRQPTSESVSTTHAKHTSQKVTTSPTDIPLTVIPVTFITSSTKVGKTVDPSSVIPTSIYSPLVVETKIADRTCISTNLGHFGTVGCIDTNVPAATVTQGISR